MRTSKKVEGDLFFLCYWNYHYYTSTSWTLSSSRILIPHIHIGQGDPLSNQPICSARFKSDPLTRSKKYLPVTNSYHGAAHFSLVDTFFIVPCLYDVTDSFFRTPILLVGDRHRMFSKKNRDSLHSPGLIFLLFSRLSV